MAKAYNKVVHVEGSSSFLVHFLLEDSMFYLCHEYLHMFYYSTFFIIFYINCPTVVFLFATQVILLRTPFF